MHGRVKTRTTEEQKERARLEKCKKAKSYRTSMDLVLEKRSSGIYDQEALFITANLLTGNPDIITLWNYRREIFLKLKDENPEGYEDLLQKDLSLTEQCLRINPKSYGSWHHRIWVLDNMPNPDWGREVTLCTKYLQLDERNFHCWDYRRTVTQKSNVPDLSEYKYTLEKIEANFSNYSAWHLRSKLLPKIFPDPEKKFPIDKDKHKEELELVEDAAFTDPNDQSAWFYLRWLLGLAEPRVAFIFVEIKENILIVTSKSVRLNDNTKLGVKVVVEINGKSVNGIWCNGDGKMQSCIWRFKPIPELQSTDSIVLKLEENGVIYYQEQFQQQTVVRNMSNFLPTFTPSLMETLTNQLSSCEDLLELEPDSKWTLLTSIFLMVSINVTEHKSHIMKTLDKLCEVDSLRKGYYLDLRSRILMELAIMNHLTEGTLNGSRFVLSNENLTSLYHLQYLHEVEVLDFSHNQLSSESLNHFNVLLNCKCLNLKNNQIKCLNYLPVMPKLEVLLLDDNLIDKVSEKYLSKFTQLKIVSFNNNPIDKKELEDLSTMLCNLTVAFS